jgi:hypothetical protein
MLKTVAIFQSLLGSIVPNFFPTFSIYVPNKNDLHPIEKAYTHQNGVQIRNTRYRTVLIQNLGILLIVVLLGLDPPGDQMVLHGIGQRKVVVPAHKSLKVKKSFEVIRVRSAIILPLEAPLC